MHRSKTERLPIRNDMMALNEGHEEVHSHVGGGETLLLSVFHRLHRASSAKSGSLSGVIVNGDCTLDEAFAEAAKCTEDRGPASKLVFYDDTIRKLYVLDSQDKAVGHLGDGVTVAGDLQGDTIKVSSVKLLTAIGLNVGQRLRCLRLAINLVGSKGHGAPRTQRHGRSLLPFRRLVTILQRAVGPAAKRKSSIRETGAQSRRDQLRQRGDPEILFGAAKDQFSFARRPQLRSSGIIRY